MSIKKPHTKSSFFINIVLPSALTVFLFTGTLFFIVIPSFENTLLDRKREMIMELTNAATSILDKYHKDETDGLLTREQAQQIAISRIEYLRYGDENKDYFWITDMEPIMIMHPYRNDLNGQNLEDFKDLQGKKLFVEFVKVAKEQKHGFVDYMWQWKDDTAHIVPKLSYVKAFEPWNWVIGTGIYIEDVKKEIASLTQKFIWISLIISFITAMVLFYIGRQSLNIEKKRLKAESELNESKERYKSLVEASTEGFLMIMDEKITFTNNILQKMLAMDSNEIMEKSLKDFIQLPYDIIQNISTGKSDFQQSAIETNLINKNGEIVSVLANISPVVFNNREAIIISLKDISFDKQIKEELFHNKEKFKTLMDKLNLGIFRTTIDFKGRFLEANDTALNILGYNKIEELQDTYILDIFVDIDDKKTFRKILLKNGFLKNQVLKLKRKNGQLIVVSVSLVVVGDEKQPDFCDGIIEEINIESKSKAFDDSVMNEHVSFSQLFCQPVKNLEEKPPVIKYNNSIDALIEKMSMNNSDIALVSDEDNNIMGIITNSDILDRYLSIRTQKPDKVFQIMSSPIFSIYQSQLVFESMVIMKNKGINNLMIKDNNEKYSGILKFKTLSNIINFYPLIANVNIKSMNTIKEIEEYKNKFIRNLLPLIENSVRPNIILTNLSLLSDLLTKRIIEIVIGEIGPAPVPFCFFSLGSDSRKEQTLSTDQDNALIFEDVNEELLPKTLNYFNTFSTKVCTYLNDIGYDFCKGNVMAMNKVWCQPVSVWKSYFKKWINNGKAQDLLDICIFFDFRAVYGEKRLTDDLGTFVAEEIKHNPVFIFMLAENTLSLKGQTGFRGNIQLETSGAPPNTLEIKKAMMPIVNFGRIYALKYGLCEIGTTERINAASALQVIPNNLREEIILAFDYLSSLRLKHQATLIHKNIKPDNFINTKTLNDLDKTILKKVFSYINNMLLKLGYDFKGSF